MANTESTVGPVGLIGVGLVGTAIAERLLIAHRPVLGFDICSERLDHLKAIGGEAASCALDVLRSCSQVIVSLPESNVFHRLLDEFEHQFGAATSIADLCESGGRSLVHCSDSDLDGTVVIDTTTGEPEQMVAAGRRLARYGIHYLDATIAGSSEQVRRGEVVVMVGGKYETFSDSRPLLQEFASEILHVGETGSGSRMKLVVNLVLGLHRAVLAEGLCFAQRIGIDPSVALDVLRLGPAYSRVMDVKGRKMIENDFSVQARLSQHWKDVRLILDAGKKTEAVLPLSTVHETLLSQLAASGFGGLDNSAIIKAFQMIESSS